MRNSIAGWGQQDTRGFSPGKIAGQQRVVTVDVADTVILGPNPRRTCLTLSAGPTDRWTVALFGAATLDSGITIPPNSQALRLSYRDYG